MKASRIISFLACAATLLAAALPAQARYRYLPEPRLTLDDYWDQLGLKLSDLARVVNQENCESAGDRKRYLGCLALVDQLYLDGHSGAVFWRKDPETGEAGPAPMAYVSAMGEDAFESFRARVMGWDAGYAEAGRQPVDFDHLLEEAEAASKLAGSAKESRKVGDAFNEYYKLARDPHAAMWPSAFLQSLGANQDSDVDELTFGLDVTDDGYVVRVFPKSPAAEAGFRRNDRIVKLNGRVVDEKGLNPSAFALLDDALDARDRVSGAGPDKFLVERGQARFTAELAPRRMVLPNFEAHTLRALGSPGIGYLRYGSFNGNDCEQAMPAAIRKLSAKGVRAWILDLRGNGGGDVEIAKCVAGLFLPAGSLFTTQWHLPRRGLDGGYSESLRTVDDPLTKAPLVVLVDENSASASEMLTGALIDNGRAWIVGNRTYGKGVAQSIYPKGSSYVPDEIRSLDVVFKQTSVYFFRPSGKTHHLIGIEPDIGAEDRIPGYRERLARAKREEENSIFPIEPAGQPGETVSIERALPLSALEQCLARTGTADAKFVATHPPTDDRGDYQLLVARDVARCLVPHRK